ncbi:MAG TPA: hypothetical protein VF178_03150 [Gemmatimonadaceae bacterium]
MNWIPITLRFVHVVFGALWVGMMVFQVFLLLPAVRDVGSSGSAVLRALQRRGITVMMPLLALGTVASGMALFMRFAGGASHVALMHSPMAMAFMLGGISGLIALILGMVLVRPAAVRAAAIEDQLAAGRAGPEREAELRRLYGRTLVAGRGVAVLLLFALGAMSVARYLQ